MIPPSSFFGEPRFTRGGSRRRNPRSGRYSKSTRTRSSLSPSVSRSGPNRRPLGKRSKWSHMRAEALVSIGLTLVSLNSEAACSSVPRPGSKSSICRHGRRLTLDVDMGSFRNSNEPCESFGVLLTLWRLCSEGRLLDVRLSSSGGGIHIVADHPCDDLATRLRLGDDTQRAEWDERRAPYHRHVLFCEKGGRRR